MQAQCKATQFPEDVCTQPLKPPGITLGADAHPAAGQSPWGHPCTQSSPIPAPPARPNPLTRMKPPNWVCSRFLVSALLNLPSGSAELLYTKAAVAKAFSRSEPFLRARGGEKEKRKKRSYQPIRKSGPSDIIERNLSEPS